MNGTTHGLATGLTLGGFAAIGIGAAIGAWLRWLLALGLNALAPALPLGTLVANVGGGFLIGLAIGYFEVHAQLAHEWRLLVITGFLGGLTTFSTFTAESMILLQKEQYLWALAHSGVHLFGSLLCCLLGFALYRAIS